MKPIILAQAAEAIIYKKGDNIIKDRIKKSYRISEIDNKIRRQRTKSEAKLLQKAGQIILTPIPLINNKSLKSGGWVGKPKDYQIIMPFIDGKKLSEDLDNFPLSKQKQILNQIGQDVAKLHDIDIIHGDLTTSNMILVENNSPASQKNKKSVNNKIQSDNTIQLKKEVINNNSPIRVGGENLKIFFIDFGLGYISKKIEDRAVDIHLLRQALEAKHFKNWEILFKEFEKGYIKDYPEAKKNLGRLNAVEKRGRYKH